MAKKNGNSSGKGSKKGSSEGGASSGDGDRLQAVVLTDSFETRFMPLTKIKPRCLLPLANKPLISYTFEFLTQANVDEVFLVCGSHVEQIENYIRTLKWLPFKIHIINSVESQSVGDCMRDVDNRGIISGDFILISGDLVTNLDFNKAWEFHQEQKARDKDYISTMCLGECSNQYDKLRGQDIAAFAFNEETQRCIYYQEILNARSKKKASIDIDPDLFEDDDDDFILRNNLIDCHVDICTEAVPAIFQENFDYQYLRKDFLKGVLTSDLLKKHIYAYITENEYAARVESWKTYDMISQDLINRSIYPLTIENNNSYSYEMPHIYKDENIVLAQSCKIEKNTVIGKNTKIGADSFIENSILGENCLIGSNVIIKNSYIWDNCVIKDNSVIDHSIVADGCTINGNLKDSVVSYDIDLNASFTGVRLANASHSTGNSSDDSFSDSEDEDEDEDEEEDDDDDDDDDEAERERDRSNTLSSANAPKLYESSNEDDSDEEEDVVNTLQYQVDELQLSDSSISSMSRNHRKKKRRTLSSTSYITEDEDSDEEEDFIKEGIATIERAMENNHDLDTALLELNTLRMSMNVTYHEVRVAVITAMIKRVYTFIITQTLPSKEAVLKIFHSWGALLARITFDEDEYEDLFNIIQQQILEIDNFEDPATICFLCFNTLYDIDVLEEDHVLNWWATVTEEQRLAPINRMVTKWVEWLQTAEEDSEGETEEESDEE